MPAILEYLPYRKGDSNAVDDSVRHPWYAGHGYAGVRVDIRGSGDSHGILLDEYHPQEQLDCLEVLRWLAAQPWCTGNVGMMGISWGGFNSLQVAAHRPPELKAIITCCSTDDRYGDDVHYYGGLPLAFYLLPWASVMLAYNARPPDPAVVGDGWREEWLKRHRRQPVPRRDVAPAPAPRRLLAPGIGVRGLRARSRPRSTSSAAGRTATRTPRLRLLDGLSCPRKGLIGPVGARLARGGLSRACDRLPAGGAALLGSLAEGRAERRDGRPDAPLLAAGERRAARRLRDPARALGGGADVALAAARRHDTAPRRPTASRADAGDGTTRRCSTPLTVGADAGSWLPYGNPADLPGDQRDEDAWSLCFDSAPLEARDRGARAADRRACACAPTVPIAFAAVRLCEVRPDGTSTLITRGALNLCRRNGHDRSDPLEPGRVVRRRGAAQGDLLRRAAGPPRCGSRSRPRTGRGCGPRRSRSS